MKRCLITGGFGFIGKNLCEAIKTEYEIIILDRKDNTKISSQFNFVVGDCGNGKYKS